MENQLKCEICESNNFIKHNGFFICQNCGCKYTVDEIKKTLIKNEDKQANNNNNLPQENNQNNGYNVPINQIPNQNIRIENHNDTCVGCLIFFVIILIFLTIFLIQTLDSFKDAFPFFAIKKTLLQKPTKITAVNREQLKNLLKWRQHEQSIRM